MVFIYHRLRKPSIFDFESIPWIVRRALFYVKHKMFPNINVNITEPERPILYTNIPGPKTIGSLNDLALFSYDYNHISVFANEEKSYLNFIVDSDGNSILNLNNVGLPLGYNNPLLIKNSYSHQNELLTINRNSDSFKTMSNESISDLKSYLNYLKRGNLNRFIPVSDTESTLASLLSLNSRFNSNNRDFVLNLSNLIDSHVRNSSELEFDFLNRISKDIITYLNENSSNLLGLIVEPISLTKNNGHIYLNESIVNSIQEFCNSKNIAFIIDETNSALNSGSLFGIDNYKLKREPDYVILKNKSSISQGILTNEKNASFINDCERVNLDTYRINSSVVTLKYIQEEKLLEKSKRNGEYVRKRLNESLKFNGDKIENIRGIGSYTSFDIRKGSNSDFFKQALNTGILVNKAGKNSITLRSSLVIKSNHFEPVFDVLNNYKI